MKIENTFELIKELNFKFNNLILSSEEEQEEEENIKQLPQTISRLDKILENIKNLKKSNQNTELINELIQLHLVLGDIEWQYDQLHAIVRKAISNIEYK